MSRISRKGPPGQNTLHFINILIGAWKHSSTEISSNLRKILNGLNVVLLDSSAIDWATLLVVLVMHKLDFTRARDRNDVKVVGWKAMFGCSNV